MNTTDIEFLLEQWGLYTGNDLGLGLGRGSEKASIACDPKDLDLLDWAVGQIGLTNRRRKNILKHKYLSPDLDDNGYPEPKSDAMVALHFRAEESDITSEINAAINDLDYLMATPKPIKKTVC